MAQAQLHVVDVPGAIELSREQVAMSYGGLPRWSSPSPRTSPVLALERRSCSATVTRMPFAPAAILPHVDPDPANGCDALLPTEARFEVYVTTSCTDPLSGLSPRNAVNRLAGSRGIQIEQSARLRQLPDARGRVAQSIAEALVPALG
jgi:hypothetical protein